MSPLRCILVTPESTLRDDEAEFVALPLYDGEIGIARDHTPLIGRLGFGELRIRHQGQVERYYIEGGFVEVVDNVISVLTPRAIPAVKLDSAAAGEQLVSARQRPAHSPELMEIRDRAVTIARAQLQVSQRAATN
jgi:F-type H+-transporting ATPase subunit epsilon